jgi:CheY-like chemotaxis protein
MLCEALQNLGYTVLIAANGQEALRTFEARLDEIDLVLFDVVMPKLSGPDALLRIRSLRPEIPAILATGYSSEAEIFTSLAGPRCQVLQKPYTTRALARKIRELLDTAGPAAIAQPGKG